VDEFATARSVVAASNAISAATPVQLVAAVQSGELCVLPFRPPWLALDTGFIRLRGRAISPAAAHYMQIVRELEAELAEHNRVLADTLLAQRPAASDSSTGSVDGIRQATP